MRYYGHLEMGHNGRWQVLARAEHVIELTSGSVATFQVGREWIETRIEYRHGGYYAWNPDVQLYEGMPAYVEVTGSF